MKGIMVDNWFMEEVLFSMPDDSKCCSKEYANLLEAIVLWNQVYYPRNACSAWSINGTSLQHLLTPIDDWNEEGSEAAMDAFMLSEYTHKKQQLEFSPFPNPIVGVGALRYVTLSAKNGLDYLPCSARREYLKNHLSLKEFGDMLSCLKAQGFIDSLISDQIASVFQPFLSDPDFLFEMPALAQYIINCTPPDMTPAEFAIHLREEGPTIRYRQYLKEFSDAFRSENALELGYLQSISREVVSDVLAMGKRSIKSMHCRLFPSFSFSANTSIGEIGINISPTGISGTWSTAEKTFHRKNLTFLTDITQNIAQNVHVR